MNQLTLTDQDDFARLESIVKRGVASFVETGSALREIRDRRLYRETHKTFDDYLTARWNLDRGYATRLIAAADVTADVATLDVPPPKNEAQTRELKKAPKEKRAEVWEKVSQKAQEKGKEPTAKMVAEEVAEALPIGSAEELEPQQPQEPKPPENPKEIAVRNGAKIDRLVVIINSFLQELRALQTEPGLEVLLSARHRIEAGVVGLKSDLKRMTPHAICPRCNGKGCGQCGNEGWVNRDRYQELTR